MARTIPFLLGWPVVPIDFGDKHSVLVAPIWFGNLVGAVLHPKPESSWTSAANSTVPSSSGEVAYKWTVTCRLDMKLIRHIGLIIP